MIDSILLGVIAASLLWGQVLGAPVTRWLALRAMRKRVVSGSFAAPPKVEAQPLPSMSFLLCDPDGKHVEHEIAFHGADAPETYEYAGKTYRQEKRRHVKDDPTASVWEYRR